MARPPKGQRDDKSLTPGSPPKNEEDTLIGDFLSEFELEEVSFDQWVNCESSLDLVVEAKVTMTQLDGNSEISVKYTKLVNKKKVKTSVAVAIPKNCSNGEEIRLPQLGDQDGLIKGDLIVRIRIS